MARESGFFSNESRFRVEKKNYKCKFTDKQGWKFGNNITSSWLVYMRGEISFDYCVRQDESKGA